MVVAKKSEKIITDQTVLFVRNTITQTDWRLNSRAHRQTDITDRQVRQLHDSGLLSICSTMLGVLSASTSDSSLQFNPIHQSIIHSFTHSFS